MFKDITPLLLEPQALGETVELLAKHAESLGGIDYVIAAEARGFILGAAVATRIGAGFIPARKPGKLPSVVSSVEYELEYGLDTLEMHSDALAGGKRVLVHDDLLATGGTAKATCSLVEEAGASVAGCSFVIELSFLGGREALAGYDVHALIDYTD